MGQDEYDTAALAGIGDVADCVARADAQVRAVLGKVMPQCRSTAVAGGYVAPQYAGCTGQVENCVTTVFSAYVTARGQAAYALGEMRGPTLTAAARPHCQDPGCPSQRR